MTEILKTLTNISAIVYCQRNGTPDFRNQLISSGFLVIPITRCLISKMKRRTELMNEYQVLNQDVQLELASLRFVFQHRGNLQLYGRSFVQIRKRNRKQEGGGEKMDRGEKTVGPTDEAASTERVS